MPDNEEQPTAGTEQITTSEKEKGDVSEASKEVSVESKGVGEEGAKIDISLLMNDPEFKKVVQSAADKASNTARRNALREIQKAKEEVETAKAEAEESRNRAEWRGRQEAEKQSWLQAGISEEQIAAFQTRERQLIEAMGVHTRQEKSYKPKIDKAERLEAAETAISDVLGEDSLVSLSPTQFKAVCDAAEGDTLRERIAYAKLKTMELKTALPTKLTKESEQASTVTPRRPDPGTSGAVGTHKLTAGDVAKMSPQERWEKRKEIAEIPLGI